MIKRRIAYTTSAGGAADVSGEQVSGGALLECVEYLPGTTDTGATVTVTDEYSGASFTLWVQATAGTSNIREYPRQLENLNTDGSALATHTRMVVMGKPRVVIASGGNTKAGAVVLHLRQV